MSEKDTALKRHEPEKRCTRCETPALILSRDWEECDKCSAERDEWERDTPVWQKLGMKGMWDE